MHHVRNAIIGRDISIIKCENSRYVEKYKSRLKTWTLRQLPLGHLLVLVFNKVSKIYIYFSFYAFCFPVFLFLFSCFIYKIKALSEICFFPWQTLFIIIIIIDRA